MSKKATATKDPVFRAMEAASEMIRTMTTEEGFQLAVRAGIYTKDGKLTEPYRASPPQPKRARVSRAGGKLRRPKSR
jgi:hypothetical protein